MKHACAKAIHIQLVQSKKHVSLIVQDNGCGFDEKKVVIGRGLQNIRDRVTSGKGKIDITSSPGKGTEATVELPI
jgi:signal transduction histidine kinase